jgi:hypothetical protein
MTKTLEQVWEVVEESLNDAKAIAFDGCHKIYVLLDHSQVHQMAIYGYGYDEGTRLVHAIGSDKDEMLKTLKSWYNDSCALRFIDSVETVREGEDQNKGFASLIPQGYEEEFCKACGEFGTDYDGYCSDCREEDEDEELEEDEDEE